VSAAGFLLNVAALFERFVEAEVSRAAASFGGTIHAQKRDFLDADALIVVKPDLVWVQDGTVRAVLDAKYKADHDGRHPNADIYQMLAYCVRHGLNEGHLIYAAGNEVAARYVVEQANVTVVCHAVDLNRAPADIQAQLNDIVTSASPIIRRQIAF